MSDSCDGGSPPQPTEEHRRLEERLGTWTVDCKMFSEPGQPPSEYQAEETVEALGPFWTVSSFKAEFGGFPFEGRCTFGFDTKTGKHVSTWQDTMSPFLCVFSGERDAEGTLVMTAPSVLPWTGEETVFHTTERQTGPDERVFEMRFEKDGQVVPLAEYSYRRKR